ncbi:MAG: hypothetical protein M0000_05715 [Actinomycetota bacterium]|nr:hypothetical protein [Actinomycetota bacterium]
MADFQFDQSEGKRVIKLLNIADEYDRRWLASRAARSIDALGVIATLDGLVAENGAPVYLRVDHGLRIHRRPPGGLVRRGAQRCPPRQSGTPDPRQPPTVNRLTPGIPATGVAHVISPSAHGLPGETSPSVSSHRRPPQENRRHNSLGYLTPTEFRELDTIEQRQVLAGAAKYRGWGVAPAAGRIAAGGLVDDASRRPQGPQPINYYRKRDNDDRNENAIAADAEAMGQTLPNEPEAPAHTRTGPKTADSSLLQ